VRKDPKAPLDLKDLLVRLDLLVRKDLRDLRVQKGPPAQMQRWAT
jgi:hypothetical protein